jgi:nucleotide-binding universal stress UspA family protein
MKGDKPFPRIVVPTDGSGLSQSAAYAAAPIARRAGVPLTLFGAMYSERERDNLANELNELITSLRRELVIDVIIDVLGAEATASSYVADAILEEADVDGALVCIASHGRSGLGSVLLGSTTEAVLRRSSRPVLVVGPKFDANPWPDEPLVVACLDGSPYAEQALPTAAEWSASFDLPMWLIQVAAPDDASTGRARRSGDFQETGYLRSAVDRALVGESSDVNFEVLHSRHPARELADLTHRWQVAIMVMATHGRSGWTRLTLGSVAMNVVHHASCPVLLIPPAAGVHDGGAVEPREAMR